MENKRISDIFKTGAPGDAVRVSGLLRTRRDAKGFSFLEMNDGSSVKSLQAVVDASLANYESEVQKAATGASVTVEGVLAASPGKGQSLELQATVVIVHGFAGEDYPLQKKKHSFEFLRTLAHLRPRTNTFGAVARVRNALSFAIHSFFQERGFLHVHTPVITASDCEGAGALFRVTTLDLMNVPKTQSGVDFTKDFFGKPANLTVSGQLEGECYATALGSIYAFGPTFRAENSNTARHLAEFWMVEPEMSFCDIRGNMDMAEAFLKTVFSAVMDRCHDDLAFFNQFI
ncbi:MAG: amino acid--tRNA ligase-related protein, partial [Fibrobacterota bacterium]